MIQSILISGANRGIGLEFVKQLTKLSPAPKFLFAGCRNPARAEELKKWAALSQSTKVHVFELDVDNEEHIENAFYLVSSVCGSSGLNLLINNAGTFKQEKLDDVNPDELLREFRVNCLAPLMISKAFLPLLRKAADKQKFDKLSASRAAIINISTKMGSIDANNSGGMYSYRTSKAALNMVTRSLSVDLRDEGILVITFHPGWVRTEMSGRGGLIDPPESVAGMIKFMLAAGEKEHGQFFTYAGLSVPWQGRLFSGAGGAAARGPRRFVGPRQL